MNLLIPWSARLLMVSSMTLRRVSSLNVMVPLNFMWWGE